MKNKLKKIFIIFINFFIFFLKFFFKKNNNILLFSSGNDFSGNSKYLYLFYSNDEKFKCYWISSNKKLINSLKLKKLRAINRWSFKTIYLTIVAKFIFVNSGVNSVCDYKITGETCIINLWHGTPIKKIFNDEKNKTKLFKTNLTKHLNSFNYFISASENLTKMFSRAINNPNISICPLGTPSNDVLYKSIKDNTFRTSITHKVRKYFSIGSDKKIILYCPTHRDENNSYDLEKLENFYKKILNFSKKNNYVLLNKFHPLRVPRLKEKFLNDKNFIDITKYKDVQEFLISSDLMITDYSSIVFDYSILGKPYIFFQYDYDKYSKSRDYYYSWDIFPTEVTYEVDRLLEKIAKSEYFDFKKNIIFSNQFNKGDGSCKRIYEFFSKKKINESNFYKKKYNFIQEADFI